MCGIVGILSLKIGQDVRDNKSIIENMNGTQIHRGPDDCGYYFDSEIALGHRRLSIIDLSKMGHQPMELDEFVMVFNGEIYNYVELKKEMQDKFGVPFKTKSDTEVLLWGYKIFGENVLKKINGMFAFAIWNKNKKTLFCARDRIGIKPFYYAKIDGKMIFSSEVKSILSAIKTKPSPNYNVIKQYLMQGGYGLPNETFFEGICSLEPSHYMMVDKNVIKTGRYWGISETEKFDLNEENKAMDQYLELMLDAVKIRLRSDVKIGINVSGGLDSSALLGSIDYYYGKHVDFNLYTYTCNDPIYDEVTYVRRLIDKKTYDWHICPFEEKDFYSAFLSVQLSQDEPFGGLPVLAYSEVFKKAREDGVIVLLSGNGMDEQLAGYDYYKQTLDKNIDVNTVSTIQNTSSAIQPMAISKDFSHGYSPIVYNAPFKLALDNLKYRDLFFTKIPRAIRFEDRMSMAYSTELRTPFLDYRLIELSFKMPSEFLIKNGQGKCLLRKMVENILPFKTLNAQKRPLQTPQREWIRNDKDGWVRDILFSKSFRDRNIFDHNIVEKMYNDYNSGCFDNSFFIWQWLNLEIWFRLFIDNHE